MTKAHRLKTRKPSGLTKGVPLNFLLGCSEQSLGNFVLARYAEASDVRKELLVIIDRLTEQMMLARLGEWFRDTDRKVIKAAVENPIDVMAWVAEEIRNQRRSEEEVGEDGYLIPLPSLPPGAAHLAAAIRYQERNIAEGKCVVCPEPLDRNSVRYCSKHLAMERNRARKKKGLNSDPGSRDYLYTGDIPESTHGRQSGTLKQLAMNREQKTREVLAELGVKPESAAVTKRAVKKAIMERMPNSKDEAKSASELFLGLPTSDSLAKKALAELFSEIKIQRAGKGTSGEPFRYFTT